MLNSNSNQMPNLKFTIPQNKTGHFYLNSKFHKVHFIIFYSLLYNSPVKSERIPSTGRAY